MIRSSEFFKNKSYYFPLLLVISTISHFPFVLNGFGEIDATKIAVSVIDMINNGPDAAFSNYYFTDVIPMYILYLSLFMKILNNNYSYLPLVMNYSNAVIGTLVVIPAFFLVRQLFGSSAIAFCSTLALIFAPSFYQSTIMGFPHLIAFFFLLIAFYLHLAAIDHEEKKNCYLLLVMSCISLTVAFLFKSDYVLGGGAFIGFLFMRKTKDKGLIAGTILMIITAGILFLIFRNMIIGSGSGTTMSKTALSDWYNYSLIIPKSLGYLIRQTKPIAYGAGIFTFFLGMFSFFYYLVKKRVDVLAFILSWAAVPTFFWIVMIGNNARHNMFTILPILVLIVIFFHERAPKYLPALSVLLILGNFFIVYPSSSILTPSGRLFKSNTMLKERMEKFHSSAKQISTLDDKKIVVLGYFHNPHVIFEIMKAAPSYESFKIGREDYKVMVGDREFVFLYFVIIRPEDMEEEIEYFINKYDVEDHVFTSATYDLTPIQNLGLNIKTVDIIERSSL